MYPAHSVHHVLCTLRPGLQVGEALSACGSTILLSSTTNAIAFGLGARSPLPALQGFCAYAALGMACDLLFQLSFFVAGSTWSCVTPTQEWRILQASTSHVVAHAHIHASTHPSPTRPIMLTSCAWLLNPPSKHPHPTSLTLPPHSHLTRT